MNKEDNIVCVKSHYMQNFGYLSTVHLKCEVVGKTGGVNIYKCSCCGDEFRGGINGAFEVDNLNDYEETQNFIYCTDENFPFGWYLKQISILHHKYCHSAWNYNERMKPILTDCCKKFNLAVNKMNFERLTDAAVRKIIHKDIQTIIDNDKKIEQ